MSHPHNQDSGRSITQKSPRAPLQSAPPVPPVPADHQSAHTAQFLLLTVEGGGCTVQPWHLASFGQREAPEIQPRSVRADRQCLLCSDANSWRPAMCWEGRWFRSQALGLESPSPATCNPLLILITVSLSFLFRKHGFCGCLWGSLASFPILRSREAQRAFRGKVII